MQNSWLYFLDVFFTLLHIIIIGFNLLGWIWKSTRKLHFYSVLLTAFFWFVLGFWFGFGYCPITDWQWKVKSELGEQGLPNSFIKYITDKMLGSNIDISFVDRITGTCFGIVTLLSVYLNFFKK